MTELLRSLAGHAELEDGQMPTEAVLIVGFLQSDGEGAYSLLTAGDCTISTTIGLLSMASHDLMHKANPTPCEEDD